MPILIKNCGMKTPETIATALRTGALFIGFVHSEDSPRHLELAKIATLAKYVPAPRKRVIVTTDPNDALLDAIKTHPLPDFLQIHGVTDPARVEAIAARIGIPLITAIHVTTPDDLILANGLEPLSAHILFDASHPGSGQAFDWVMLRDALASAPLKKPWFLAGGLNPSNVADAIRITRAPMVDVSSGIESARGVKSEEMIAAFNAAVLNASA